MKVKERKNKSPHVLQKIEEAIHVGNWGVDSRRKHKLPQVGEHIWDWIVVDNGPVLIDKKRGTKGVVVQCKCGALQQMTISSLMSGYTKRCFNCRDINTSRRRYEGVGDLSGTYYTQIRNGAKQRNLEFSVSKEYLWNLYQQQNGKCALSGITLDLTKNFANILRKTGQYVSASIDRIDSTRGYVEGNVQWVHKDINQIKHKFGQEVFIKMCKLVAKTHAGGILTQVIAREVIEGLHYWGGCDIEEVFYLKFPHRHRFNVIAMKSVSHNDRDVEFIKLSHEIREYLNKKYYDEQLRVINFGSQSCEMIARELFIQFKLDNCEVNEDGEGGAIVRPIQDDE